MHQAQPLRSLLRLNHPDTLNRREGNRVNVSLYGTCSIGGGADIACSTLDISMSGARVSCTARPEVGERAVLSLDHVGLLSGIVIRSHDNWFAVEFNATLGPKVVKYVNWVRNASVSGERMTDEREHQRIIPLKRLARITRGGGLKVLARIIDVSRSGLGVDNPCGLMQNECVMVGSHHATVIRTWQCGAGIKFDEMLPSEDFDISISLI